MDHVLWSETVSSSSFVCRAGWMALHAVEALQCVLNESLCFQWAWICEGNIWIKGIFMTCQHDIFQMVSVLPLLWSSTADPGPKGLAPLSDLFSPPTALKSASVIGGIWAFRSNGNSLCKGLYLRHRETSCWYFSNRVISVHHDCVFVLRTGSLTTKSE